MCGDCFVCIYIVCQCDGLELGMRNRRITVRGVVVRINTFITPAAPPTIPPVWEHVISLGGTKHESLGDLSLPYLSRRLLDVGIGDSPI